MASLLQQHIVGIAVNSDISNLAEDEVLHFKDLAEEGSSKAQYLYGACLEAGHHVAKNSEEAVRYYKLSADQGHADGQWKYGRCLALGIGVDRNNEEAALYFKLSADQGNSNGQNCYGVWGMVVACLEILKRPRITSSSLPKRAILMDRITMEFA